MRETGINYFKTEMFTKTGCVFGRSSSESEIKNQAESILWKFVQGGIFNIFLVIHQG